MMQITELVQTIVRSRLREGAIALDATVGNGMDTLFLAECVGKTGMVFGCDIQPLEDAQQLITNHNCAAHVHLRQMSHEDLRNLVPEKFHGHLAAVMFNLGYKPHADKTLITHTASTLAALEAATALLAPNGIMSVVCYTGHAGGSEERDGVVTWAAQLEKSIWQIYHLQTLNQHHAPEALMFYKRR
jgi:16S rRNA C1402 N4-methylase RsmH